MSSLNNILGIVILIVSIGWFCLYLKDMKNRKLSTKEIVIIGMFSAMSYILSMIQFIKYPQGGGITLFSMLPTMLLAILYGKEVGITAGLVFALIKLISGPTIIHPAQFLLDYILPMMVLGLAGIFGRDKKFNIFAGCILATSLSVLMYIISGVLYFAQYAPKGMNPIVYSCVYNISSAGVEGLLTSILILFIPIKRFSKVLNISISQ
ncbi:energy-coupled thiamine transporter ThiT [Romboutsia hominis]|uniref:Proton-coupled thiamine transporter n=1 Tax=Romboutsia hominis TaxID=1507512 RepID=A0A2P2BPU0_9FIRM|nr:energy-coupled thiamine transporter ThiT [Romboutsia hominis]CEI72351.1 Proton-coupled thiamine transporter [Romboutsia hominis]